MGFKDFKAKMKSTDTQEKLQSAFKEKSYDDERYWSPQRDQNGNFTGVIRFLPAGQDEEQYYVTMYNYAFQNKKTEQWYIENSLRTIKKPDPVGQANQELWNTGDENNKNIVRGRKQYTKFIGNILVIRDDAKPENNGKVFLYKYGKAIQNKINEAINPKFADEKPINPYDFWDGANFKMRIFKDPANGFPSYDKCQFDNPSPLFDGDDERIEKEVYEKLYPLQPEIGADKFKTYDELLARFHLVEGITAQAPTSTQDNNPDYVERPKQTATPQAEAQKAPEPATSNDDQEPALDDDILDLLND